MAFLNQSENGQRGLKVAEPLLVGFALPGVVSAFTSPAHPKQLVWGISP